MVESGSKGRLWDRTWYRWVVFAACFLMVFTCVGFCCNSKNLFLTAITEALGIKRSLFTINDSIRFVIGAVVSLFFGPLIYRFGERKLIAAGFLSFICSMLLYARARSIYGFYLGGVFMGMGLAFTSTNMVGYVAKKWFRDNYYGTVMGFILASSGLGGALSTQVVSPIIYEEGNPFGYRNAYRLMALLLFIVGALVVLCVRKKDNGAEKAGQKADGENAKGSLRQVIGTKSFLFCAICVFLTAGVLESFYSICAAHMQDVGIDEGYVATVMSVFSLVLAASKFLIGVFYDRFGLKTTLLICDLGAAGMALSLALVSNSPQGRALAMLCAILMSLGMPLETIMLPFITSAFFDERTYAGALGVIGAINTLGYAAGIPLSNLVYDIWGTYRPALFLMGGLMLGITVCFQIILRRQAGSGTERKAA